jgi:hypothetical protein
MNRSLVVGQPLSHHLRYTARMMTQQMELNFNAPIALPLARRQTRLLQARWWFTQMRRAVDRAWDRASAAPAPPEQTYLRALRI